QVRFLEDAVDRGRAQAGDVLIPHPPGHLPVPQLGVPPGVVHDRLLLLGQRLIRLYRLDRRLRQGPRPGLRLQPAVVRPPRDAQGAPLPLGRPAAPPPSQLDLLMHPALQGRRELPIVLYPESPFFSSRFSAVSSATTSLSRRSSASFRSSWALRR